MGTKWSIEKHCTIVKDNPKARNWGRRVNVVHSVTAIKMITIVNGDVIGLDVENGLNVA